MQAVAAHPFLELAAVAEQASHAQDPVAGHALDLGKGHVSVFAGSLFEFGGEVFIHFYAHVRQQAAVGHETVQRLRCGRLCRLREGGFVDGLASARYERCGQDDE